MKQRVLTVSFVDGQLALTADRDLLLSAIGNLLQNAFKFTNPGSDVSLNAYAAADRILIDIEDHCGGLAPGFEEKMFDPSLPGGENRSGLGLSIARQTVELNQGTLRVRDIAGSGCVFTVDLPRHAMPKIVPDAVPVAS